MDYTLDFKLGQMVMVGFQGATVDQCRGFLERVRRCPAGGVWLTDHNSPMGRTLGNISSPAELRGLCAALRDSAEIPMLIAIDGEGGNVIRLREHYGFPSFPSAQALGVRDDPAETRRQATLLAATLREIGINFNFAPVVDLNINPDNPIIGGKQRSFSADPEVVIRHAAEFIEAHHAAGIMCGIKHFPGHGSSATDSHKGMVDVTGSWSADELLPYSELLGRGLVDAVLSAHVCLRDLDPEHPATLSPRIIDGLLRKELDFDGVVVSDDILMRAISKHYSEEEAIARAVEAGVDMVLHSNVDKYDEGIADRIVAILRRLVESGRISEERIEQSFQRVMSLKRRYGLL